MLSLLQKFFPFVKILSYTVWWWIDVPGGTWGVNVILSSSNCTSMKKKSLQELFLSFTVWVAVTSTYRSLLHVVATPYSDIDVKKIGCIK
jgi:hypothetical protein